jgi:hypothetical protein
MLDAVLILIISLEFRGLLPAGRGGRQITLWILEGGSRLPSKDCFRVLGGDLDPPGPTPRQNPSKY